MKATVNIALRSVELEYKVSQKDIFTFNQIERNFNFKNWQTYQKNKNSKVICKHTLYFEDIDEWQSSFLFNGKTIDFHYDYEEREGFDSTKDWGNYLFQGYEYTDGEPQMYDDNVIKKVIVKY